MPLARYFLFVGGTLIALLLMLNAYLPPVPAAAVSDVQRPVVRITSDQKLPERIVIDTSIPTIVPPQPMSVAAKATKTPALEALAQAGPSDLQTTEPAKAEPKAPVKRKVARRAVRQPVLAYGQMPTYGQAPSYGQAGVKYAQAPQFNFFGPTLR